MSVYCLQVLRDAILGNQTEATFVTSAAPKAVATHHLDELSRQMCPHLRHFVVFSSQVCGRGNPGQSNYGMSNSIMERICEARVRDGFPGLAIQWSAVGDVGLLTEKQQKYTDAVGQLCFQYRTYMWIRLLMQISKVIRVEVYTKHVVIKQTRILTDFSSTYHHFTSSSAVHVILV
jgi:fatty acid synthase